MEIRRVRADDGTLLREVHLRMFADAPDAFSQTLAEAQAVSRLQWDARAERFGRGDEAVAFVVLEGQEVVGFVAGFVGRFREKAMH